MTAHDVYVSSGGCPSIQPRPAGVKDFPEVWCNGRGNDPHETHWAKRVPIPTLKISRANPDRVTWPATEFEIERAKMLRAAEASDDAVRPG